jgi:hypothetical protein
MIIKRGEGETINTSISCHYTRTHYLYSPLSVINIKALSLETLTTIKKRITSDKLAKFKGIARVLI